MLILLPDFIGHPSCFRGLLARLGATDCRLVDYHRLDAYASIEALASQVLDGLAEEPDWLIGYSFGGLVGYEMARQLPASRLLMIDSHLPWPALRRMPPSEQYQRWLSAEMREWIALMSELGELREEVLLRNVELFGRWQPRHRLVRASWVRCRDDAGRDPAAERWCDLIERLDTFPCERPHHLALQDPAVIDFIVHTVSKESVQ
ncbi:alpha/beta fold hydrolase [Pseudomonas aeruginosa]|uniref:alpha/beta fold hydrolase n=1 Tax=Pseudomonas aeruginosa TaxID=287 RepID=UPI0010672716|nr:alpha/beta fold hydrolase [Pseudomonas aeruginosa]MBY9586264.1 alpha/beta fold hydrolase [Pseudomonas aeruginosa]MBY9637758.1 alpha/beta fold hydrolase [Pseudomonas aeruginosa]QZV40955.1 alpha/beta fold hydrolase [Pseudomonas aeruginosa]TEB98192.1 alpha/beta fold hydrolase [Pseudomonas aeruginosa]